MPRYSLLLKILGFLMMLVLQVVLARLMSGRDFGDYTVIMTWINILVTLCLFGFDNSTIEILRSYSDSKSLNKIRGFVRFSFRFIITTSVLCMIVLFVFLLNNAKKHSLTYSEAFFWSIFLIPLLVMIKQCSAMFQSGYKARQASVTIGILLPLAIATIAISSYLMKGNVLRLDTVVFLSLTCTFFVAWIINAKLKREIRPTYTGALAEYEYGTWLKASALLFGLNFFPFLLSQIDILFVSYFSGNTKAGLYAAASRYALIIPLFATALESFYGSRNSEILQINIQQKFKNYFTGRVSGGVIYIIGIALLLFVLGKYFLLLYGKQFGVSYVPLVILIGAQLINVFALRYSRSYMNMSSSRIAIILIFFFSTILSLFLNYLLIPLWGMTGAAFSTCISLLVQSLVIYLMAQRTAKISI